MASQVPESDEGAQMRREWSDIQQSEHRHSTTDVARKRKWTRIWRWAALAALAAFICGALIYASVSASKDNPTLEPSSSLAKVILRTDGVLDDKWVAKDLDIHHGMSMNDVNIAKIRQKLEANGQIKSAVVSLRLPNELVVEIHERIPILRANAQVLPGVVKTLLISGEGIIYEGANYPANTIRALPYVDGITFKHNNNGGYDPVTDIAPVADLLLRARTGWPKYYRDWYIVSLRRYKGSDSVASVIDVATRSTGRLTFALNDFEDEMRRLDMTIVGGAMNDGRPILSINLAIPGQAIVEYDGMAAPAVPGTPGAQPAFGPANARPAAQPAPKAQARPQQAAKPQPVAKPQQPVKHSTKKR